MTQPTEQTKIAVVARDIEYIRKDLGEIKQSIKDQAGIFITRQEFDDFKNTDFNNVKKIVYGGVSLVLIAVVGAILNFVILK